MKIIKNKKFTIFGLIILILLLSSYLISYIILPQRNPEPLGVKMDWLSDQGQKIFTESCLDCHSNDTVYKWYHHLPVSNILVAIDVKEGRENFNSSNWDKYSAPKKVKEARQALESINRGDMPFFIYVIIHPEAKITREEYLVLYNDYIKMEEFYDQTDELLIRKKPEYYENLLKYDDDDEYDDDD